MSDPRKMTKLLLQAIDDGMVTADQVALAALNYMSESDVADMIERNELLLELDEEDEEDEEDNDSFDWRFRL